VAAGFEHHDGRFDDSDAARSRSLGIGDQPFLPAKDKRVHDGVESRRSG
jgi:hypothetical protein